MAVLEPCISCIPASHLCHRHRARFRFPCFGEGVSCLFTITSLQFTVEILFTSLPFMIHLYVRYERSEVLREVGTDRIDGTDSPWSISITYDLSLLSLLSGCQSLIIKTALPVLNSISLLPIPADTSPCVARLLSYSLPCTFIFSFSSSSFFSQALFPSCTSELHGDIHIPIRSFACISTIQQQKTSGVSSLTRLFVCFQC